MKTQDKIQLFNEKQVRTHWDEEQEKWYFSVSNYVRSHVFKKPYRLTFIIILY